MSDERFDDMRQEGGQEYGSGGAKSENGQLLELFAQGTRSGALKEVPHTSPRHGAQQLAVVLPVAAPV